MNIRSYNFASKGRSKRGLAGWRKPGLENNLAVRLGVGGELHNAVEDLVELGVIGSSVSFWVIKLTDTDLTPSSLASSS